MLSGGGRTASYTDETAVVGPGLLAGETQGGEPTARHLKAAGGCPVTSLLSRSAFSPSRHTYTEGWQ